MSIQPYSAKDIKRTVGLYLEHKEGLKDMTGYSHIIHNYDFHLSKGYCLEVKPFLSFPVVIHKLNNVWGQPAHGI